MGHVTWGVYVIYDNDYLILTRECNYTDMMICVNEKVQNFLFSSNEYIEGIP